MDKGHLPVDELTTGDIIYWLNDGNSHIGLIADLPGPTRFLFNSNGSSGTKCYKRDQNGKILIDGNKNPIIDSECLQRETAKNRSVVRGPRLMSFYDATSKSGFWGSGYKVLRLVTEIDGDWKLAARCVGEFFRDAIEATINLTSKKEVDGIIPITARGQGTDYNGDPIVFTASANYSTTTSDQKAV